jgi:hypothetical protein
MDKVRIAGRAVQVLGSGLALLLLSGCLLISGETTTIDVLQDSSSGNLNTVFVSAEGGSQRILPVAPPETELQVITIVEVESGDLQLDLLQPDGSVAFVVASRPNTKVTRSGAVRSDSEGNIHFRVIARGARNGSFQIFFQP